MQPTAALSLHCRPPLAPGQQARLAQSSPAVPLRLMPHQGAAGWLLVPMPGALHGQEYERLKSLLTLRGGIKHADQVNTRELSLTSRHEEARLPVQLRWQLLWPCTGSSHERTGGSRQASPALPGPKATCVPESSEDGEAGLTRARPTTCNPAAAAMRTCATCCG